MKEIEVIGKRVKIILAILDNEVNGLNEKKNINKAIESYYASQEIGRGIGSILISILK